MSALKFTRSPVDGTFIPFLSRWWFMAVHIRLSTIYLSTVSPGPLTVVAQPLSPGASQPYRVLETWGHRWVHKLLELLNLSGASS